MSFADYKEQVIKQIHLMGAGTTPTHTFLWNRFTDKESPQDAAKIWLDCYYGKTYGIADPELF